MISTKFGYVTVESIKEQFIPLSQVMEELLSIKIGEAVEVDVELVSYNKKSVMMSSIDYEGWSKNRIFYNEELEGRFNQALSVGLVSPEERSSFVEKTKRDLMFKTGYFIQDGKGALVIDIENPYVIPLEVFKEDGTVWVIFLHCESKRVAACGGRFAHRFFSKAIKND